MDKIQKLQALIAKLDGGKTVSRRDMKAVLTDAEMQAHDEQWEAVKAFKAEMMATPPVLKAYVDKLKVADALSQRTEAVSSKGKKSASPLRKQAEAAYEKAWEVLEDALSHEPALEQHLDRPFAEADLDEVSVPRLRNSRSQHKRAGMGQTTIRDVKRATLQQKLDELQNPQAASPATPHPMARLAKLLKITGD